MSAAARASSRLLASRSVHLRIQPRPSNLSESREILRVLQRFGEISTYKYLRYEYHNPAANTALAIYRDAESAQKALDASPLRFALEKVVQDGSEGTGEQSSSDYESDLDSNNGTRNVPVNDSVDEIIRPSTLINRTAPYTQPSRHDVEETPVPMPFEENTADPKQTQVKWFQVTVDRSRVIHQDYVERQPYWKQFVPMKSMGQEDLAKRVPLVGLSDVSKRPPHAHRTPIHVLKMMSKYVEYGMPSLKKMYEEGDRQQRD